MLLAFLLLLVSVFSSFQLVWAVDYLNYKDSDYGFEIDYPDGWIINSEFLQSGTWSRLVQFYSDNDWSGFVTVGRYANDDSYANLDENESLAKLTTITIGWCATTSIENDGYKCNEMSITNSQALVVGEIQTYQIEYSYDGELEDGTAFTDIGLMMIIPDGSTTYWEIYGQTWSAKADTHKELIANSINSFSFLDETEQIVSAETSVDIPDWVRNNAAWWSDGQIDDNTFANGIQFLIKQKIIDIPDLPEQSSENVENVIPDWIRNNAGWWSEGMISDDDFVSGIKYLVEQGIIRV